MFFIFSMRPEICVSANAWCWSSTEADILFSKQLDCLKLLLARYANPSEARRRSGFNTSCVQRSLSDRSKSQHKGRGLLENVSNPIWHLSVQRFGPTSVTHPFWSVLILVVLTTWAWQDLLRHSTCLFWGEFIYFYLLRNTHLPSVHPSLSSYRCDLWGRMMSLYLILGHD